MKNQTEQSTDTIQNYIVEGTCKAIRERYASLTQKAQASNFGMLDEDIVVLDTETTGFSLNHDELIQIAAARMIRGEISEWFITFVNPGKEIPEDIIHLTDIHNEDVVDAPTPDEAVAQLCEFVGCSDLVAHNADFDFSFVTKYVSGKGLLQNRWFDSLDLARIVLPRLKSHRLLDLVRAFDAPLSTHRADADVEALCVVYRVLLAAIREMPPPLVHEIASMADEYEWSTVAIFKYFDEENEKRTSSNSYATNVGRSDKVDETAKEEGQQPQAELPLDGKTRNAIPPFTLRRLRQERVGNLPNHSKLDADDIASDSRSALMFPSQAEVEEAFGEQGIVGKLYDDYEAREEQITMADKVLQAFKTSTNLVIEAGTGVGKSMAYLLPAALTARKSSITIGIATKTNTLLDQLVYKELPLLEKALSGEDTPERSFKETTPVSPNEIAVDTTSTTAVDNPNEMAADTTRTTAVDSPNEIAVDTTRTTAVDSPNGMASLSSEETNSLRQAHPLSYVALKGFSHYPCLRLINRIVQEGPRAKVIGGKPVLQAPALAALLSFIEQSEYDDIDSLKIDYRVLPRFAITTTSNECLRRKCPYFGTLCFVHGARRRAEVADIVVTNHSLLFCDLITDGGLLPPIRYWVIDEAHGTEAEARKAFSLTLSGEEMLRLARRVASEEASQNVFIRAERRAGADLDNATLFFALTTKARKAGQDFETAVENFQLHIKDLAFFDTNKRSKGYEINELWINEDIRDSETFKALIGYGRTLQEKAEKLVTASQEVVALLESIDSAAEIQREIATTTIALKEMINAIDVILINAPSNYAYAATYSRKTDRVTERLDALLLDVGEKLNETLFANTHSTVFTSATLTVADSFDSFETAMGLNASEVSQAASCQLDSSFDYDSNMTVYVAEDMPDPNDPAYLNALQELLIAMHIAQEGSMLTLFTNRRDMEKCFEVVQPALKNEGLRLVCQKWGVSAKGLRDEFLSDKHLSLFALKSFWEGFDAPGATLRGVIIPKLPFTKPTDPLSCERSLRDNQAWNHYVLPAAVLETKQAAGRLIRKANDRGSLILADKRLLTKGYGKAFLKSMPSRTIKVCSGKEIAEELEERSQSDESIS